MGRAGEAVCISQGKGDRSIVTLTSAGTLQWWDTAQTKVWPELMQLLHNSIQKNSSHEAAAVHA